ncbi:MAG: dihydroneopterin aldolase [Mucilaginibacter polytrichastri]|nr:dihydroneopterin aldolase [Mucilaginibacter polytrichastri]
MTIALTNLRFFAYHGFYPEEQVLGNEFFVDLHVKTGQEASNDELASTLNYEELYAIVDRHMRIPVKLIETVAQDILDAIAQDYPDVDHAGILIRKPLPLLGEGVTAEISLSFDR